MAFRDDAEPSRRRRSRLTLGIIIAAGVLLVAGLVGLGVWQIERLYWKNALIARVDARIHAPPRAPPGPSVWPHLTRENAEYLRVRLQGRFSPGHDTYVRAATEQGPGWWVISPFADRRGFTVLVNRGYISRLPVPPSTVTSVTGLLRISETGGGFLNRNQPIAGRWYSRDVAGIAAKRHLHGVAPYFVDAESNPADASGPVGGLTVIAFANNHLVYALTWFALAGMVTTLLVFVIREESRRNG